MCVALYEQQHSWTTQEMTCGWADMLWNTPEHTAEARKELEKHTWLNDYCSFCARVGGRKSPVDWDLLFFQDAQGGCLMDNT